MQAVVFLVIPGGMAFVIWRAYRRADRDEYDAGGRIRWERSQVDDPTPKG